MSGVGFDGSELDDVREPVERDEELYPEPYCVLCETEGHTLRSCPTRDDELEEEL